MSRLVAIAMLAALPLAVPAHTQVALDATTGEAGQKTAEVSTRELQDFLARGGATLLDSRPHLEYAVSHIPGALNVAAKPGMPPHLYVSDVAEIGRLLGGRKDWPLVLYCNGPHCGKSKRLAAELIEAGYKKVRRYQLGAPGWRLLGGAMQTEPEALAYLRTDRTAIWIDARDPQLFKARSIAGARNIPQSGLRPGKDAGVVKEAKDDGRLPMDDHNTRVIVFGATPDQARAVAQAIAKDAFHNVSFVNAPFAAVARRLR